MEVSSIAFKDNGFIPKQHTCDGAGFSPPLQWRDIPEGTRSLAMICDDPDAPGGMFVHWVIYNIPPNIQQFAENIAHVERLSFGAIQGKNDFGMIGYGGPCPPKGVHRYFFRLFALDETLEMGPGSSKDRLLEEMNGHLIGTCQIIGKYKRN